MLFKYMYTPGFSAPQFRVVQSLIELTQYWREFSFQFFFVFLAKCSVYNLSLNNLKLRILSLLNY